MAEENFYYQFLVHHHVQDPPQGGYGFFFQTQYDFEVEKPMGYDDMNLYASIIVAAERYIMSSDVAFHQVSMLSLDSDKGFSPETVVRQFVVPRIEFDPGGAAPRGHREAHLPGAHAGITSVYNRRSGPCRKRYIPYSFGSDDFGHAHTPPGKRRPATLRMDGPAAAVSWPVYQYLLDSLPGHYTIFDVDRFGNMVAGENIVDFAKLGSGIINNHQGQHWVDGKSPQNWLQRMLGWAVGTGVESLRKAYMAGLEFDHKWGDGYEMPIPDILKPDSSLCTFWKWLADAIGYKYPPVTEYGPPYPLGTLLAYGTPEPGTLIIHERDGLALDVMRKLWQVWQWCIENEKGRVERLHNYQYVVGDHTNPLDFEEWKGLYAFERYDERMAIAYYMVSLLVILQRALICKTPRKPARRFGQNHKVRQPRSFISNYQTHPYAFQIERYKTLFALDKFPYIRKLARNEVVVVLPNPPRPEPLPLPPPKPEPTAREVREIEEARRRIRERHRLEEYYDDESDFQKEWEAAQRLVDKALHSVKLKNYLGIFN